MLKIGIIGVGFMGFNHARVINRIAKDYPDLVELTYVIDVNREKAASVARRYGGKPLTSIENIEKNTIDFAIIATPTETHYDMFMKLLEKDVPYVFIEKPMTRNIEEAINMVETAEKHGIKISVGHIERFNPAVLSLLEHTAHGFLGEPLTTISRRVGPFAARVGNTDVIYDLGIHEIDISLSIYKRCPIKIMSYTLENLVSRLADYALIILGYDKGFSSIEVNRVAPFKQRILYLTASKGVVHLDYMNQELTIHTVVHDINVRIDKEEPLYLEDLAMIRSVLNNRDFPIDIYQAFTSLLLCEKSLESTKLGREINIENDPIYQSYSDIIRKGLEGYRQYVDMIKILYPNKYSSNRNQ